MVAFLATPAGAYITGTTIAIDGGMDAGGLRSCRPSPTHRDGLTVYRARARSVTSALAREHGPLPSTCKSPRSPLEVVPCLT